MKTCKKCTETKSFEQFPKQARNRDGLSGTCRDCENANRLAWSKANPEKRKATLDRYKEAHPDSIKNSKIKYYDSNRDLIIDKSKKWKLDNPQKVSESGARRYAKNKERILAMNKKWNAENPEKMKVYCHTRRARIRGAGGSYSVDQIDSLFIKQHGSCPVCKKKLGKSFHIDHIQPITRGGSNSIENIQLLHPKCNQEKSCKDPIEFMQSRGFLL